MRRCSPASRVVRPRAPSEPSGRSSLTPPALRRESATRSGAESADGFDTGPSHGSKNVVETTTGVEVRRRYSNPPDHACDRVERLRRLLDVAAATALDTGGEAPKQLQRRLRAHEVSELVACYEAVLMSTNSPSATAVIETPRASGSTDLASRGASTVFLLIVFRMRSMLTLPGPHSPRSVPS